MTHTNTLDEYKYIYMGLSCFYVLRQVDYKGRRPMIRAAEMCALVPNSTIHGHRLRTCYTAPPTDKLTTMLQQICYIAMPTSRHVKMLGCGKFLSVGGVVQHVRSRCPCSGVWHLCGWQLKVSCDAVAQSFLASTMLL